MLKNFLLEQIEAGLNRYLNLDPESATRLKALDGKVVTVELRVVKLTFQLQILSSRLKIISGRALPPETIIRGTPLNLLSLALTKDKKSFFADDVSIEGDAILGEKMINLFDHLDIDWEEYLSKVIGDIPAHEVGRFAKGILSWGQKAKDTLMQNMNEYVHEEKPWLPPKEALEDFFAEIDELRLDLDRLEAKIKKL